MKARPKSGARVPRGLPADLYGPCYRAGSGGGSRASRKRWRRQKEKIANSRPDGPEPFHPTVILRRRIETPGGSNYVEKRTDTPDVGRPGPPGESPRD